MFKTTYSATTGLESIECSECGMGASDPNLTWLKRYFAQAHSATACGARHI